MPLLLFVVGSLSAAYLPVLLPLRWTLYGLVIVVGLGLFRWARLPAAGLLGLLLTIGHLDWLQNNQLPETASGRDYSLQVLVNSLPVVHPKATVFIADVIRVESMTGNTLPFSLQKVRLSWYNAPKLKPGQVWQLAARLKRPRGFVNPQGFDYQAWLMSQKIGATGYVRQQQEPRLLETTFNIHQIRQTITHRIDHALSDNPASAQIIKALSVGDRSGINESAWQILKRTGTVHLMAISGLHIGLVASLAYVLGLLLARSAVLVHPFFSAGLAIRWLPAILSTCSALLYSAMAGFSIPTQRALIIVVLANVAAVSQKRVNPFHLLLLAAALMSLLDPMLSFNSGFWLSFGAVLILLSLFYGRRNVSSRMETVVSSQLALSLGLLIPLLILGQAASLISPVANLVAVPLVSIAVIPLVLLGALASLCELEVAALLLQMSAWLIEWMWQYLAWLETVSWATWWPYRPLDYSWIVAGALGVSLCFVPRGLALKLAAIPLLFVIFLPHKPSDYQLKLDVLDVGQGLASVLQVPGQAMVYDAGPRFSARFDAGSRIVVPFLQRQGIHSLDQLLISHSDLDHSGGAPAVLNMMDVEQTLLSENEEAYLPYDTVVEPCHAGQQWSLGEVQLTVLWPPRATDALSYSRNNQSCVLLVRVGEIQILMPGDIESEVEHSLLHSGLLPRDITVLIAPHHGSKTSSSSAFVAHINPQYVVFSAAYKGRYGHPHRKVVERYRRLGSQILNTATDGALSFTWNFNGELKLERARVNSTRFWIAKD